jgi:orotate phosphoribosyltransferase
MDLTPNPSPKERGETVRKFKIHFISKSPNFQIIELALSFPNHQIFKSSKISLPITKSPNHQIFKNQPPHYQITKFSNHPISLPISKSPNFQIIQLASPFPNHQISKLSLYLYLRRMTNEKAVAEKLLQVNAVKLNPEQPFTWASGWKSPIYCDNRKILSFPFTRDFIKSEMCNIIFEKFPEADLLAGVATAGIAWGAMAADQLKLPYIYVRPKPKEHGLGNQIEGFYERGQKVVVIEDLVSTGKSSLQVVDVLKEEGLEVIGMVSIFTYGFTVATEAFAKASLAYQSLTSYPVLIEMAIEKGIISASQQEVLLKWRDDPAGWNGI